jgi:hypothetical protein
VLLGVYIFGDFGNIFSLNLFAVRAVGQQHFREIERARIL